ncbi:hypothetical protein CDAR_180661 [Caerostris darwini]|uniref:Ycf15 n=1 Tax=Caerostris darwini TaxID=1538125 RepID=A0AAV4PFP1_9ARAC|nr:hypothetical protein CDAR_180661 [Caerostris darwini]
MFFRQRILLKHGKKGVVRFECSELFVLSRRRAISSFDNKNQDESTRDNRRILDDICLPSSTKRDVFLSNDQMSPAHGFSLSRLTNSEIQCFWRIR